MKRFLVAFIIIFPARVAYGQHHTNAWFRLTLRGNLNKKWSADGEFQLRRQDNNDDQLLANPLMYSFRSFFNYRLSRNAQAIFSPFAAFHHYALKSDGSLAQSTEYRFTTAFYYQLPVFKNHFLYQRPAAAYRVFSNKGNEIRLRYQLGMKLNISKRFSLKPYEEIMLHSSVSQACFGYEQSRTALMAGTSLFGGLELEAGYMHIDKSVGSEDNLLVYFTYKFERRKKEARDKGHSAR